MENEMMNEVVETSAVQELTEQATEATKGNGLMNAAIVGGIMTLGALAWEFGAKPAIGKLRQVIKKTKSKHKAETAKKDDDEIIGDLEEDYPIK